MKILHNITENIYFIIDEVMGFQIGDAQNGLHKAKAVIIRTKEFGFTPIGVFDEEEKAKKCLKRIINFFKYGENPHATDKDILEIENEIKESVLQAPESLKNNKVILK